MPALHADITTYRVLAMDFVARDPIESLLAAPQATRDTGMRMLIGLVLRELFEFGLMQTDPNFVNYRYQANSGRIVLLDCGAARPIGASTSHGYLALLRAGLGGDLDAVHDAAVAVGFLGKAAVQRHRALIDRMIGVILGEFSNAGPFYFRDSALVGALREEGTTMAADRDLHVPPIDTLFTQRKISGTAALAARLKARVDVRALIAEQMTVGNVAADASL